MRNRATQQKRIRYNRREQGRPITDQECYKRLCLFGETPDGIYPEKVKTWIVGDKCRECGKPIAEDEFAIWNTYWKAMWVPCHKACRESGMKQEAIDCQTIDADCNDCRHFERGERISVGVFSGTCKKTGLATIAQPNFCSGHPCFEHRKVGAT